MSSGRPTRSVRRGAGGLSSVTFCSSQCESAPELWDEASSSLAAVTEEIEEGGCCSEPIEREPSRSLTFFMSLSIPACWAANQPLAFFLALPNRSVPVVVRLFNQSS